jgi:surface antigen
MKTWIGAVMVATIALSSAAQPALADRGRGHRGHEHYDHGHGNYEYEYYEQRCKRIYKETRFGYKEVVKCRHAPHRDYVPPRRVWNHDYPAWHHRRGPDSVRQSYIPPFGLGTGVCNRDLIGAALGAALGGLTGSQIGRGTGQLAAVGAGVFLGGLIGGSLGRSMDDIDQNCVGQALEYVPSNETVAWRNPDSGAAYRVTPQGTYQNEAGTYCREYQTVATIGGRTESLYGTACRMPDGSWQIVE